MASKVQLSTLLEFTRMALSLPKYLLIGASLLALAACDAANTNSASSTSPAMQAAAQMKQQGNLQGAMAAYSQILEKNPDSNEAAIEVAALYRKAGQPDKALALMQAANKRAPANPDILTQLGYAMIDSGQPEEAVAVFDQLSAIKKDDVAAYNGKAVAFDNAGNHLAAQDLYRHALELSPGAAHIENNLAMSLILSGDAKEATTILQPLHKRDPDNAVVRQNLAMAYGISGNSKKALELNKIDNDEQTAKENVRYYKEYAKQMAKEHTNKKNIAKLYQEAPKKKLAVASPAPAPASVIAAAPAPVILEKMESTTSLPLQASSPLLQPAATETLAPAVSQASEQTDKSIAEGPQNVSPSSGNSEVKDKDGVPMRHSQYPTRHGDWSTDTY